MTNLEFKKDSTWGTISNLALDSIVIVLYYYDRTEGFRPMVSSALWGKAPAARQFATDDSDGLERFNNPFDRFLSV